MKRIVIGTAGHIDHGKTTLIRALTGIDCDRLKEEKERGITTELAFAHWHLDDDLLVGIVDVPGHEKFIKNMLAGVATVDFALLVIAADDGVMPQTREHLDILNLLQIADGMTVITKIDKVEPDWLDLVTEDIREYLKNSFLADKPIIAVDSLSMRGIAEVKELIENAIDAQATQIRIDIEQGGLGLIQVTDNGHGIHPDDMTLAITRHATSKLADVAQLMGINSLGFRGEALASIAAVSHLTLTSSHDDTGIGQQLTVSGSEVSQATLRPIVKQRGTTVTVRDLYYNVPARRANLKSIATEFSHIEQIVQRLAISFADVTILLYHQDKPRLQLGHSLPAAPSATSQPDVLLTRLEQALNLPLTSMAVPFFLSLEGLLDSRAQQTLPHLSPQVHGWLFVHHTINLPKLIYINQRLVTDFTIGQALQKVARQLGLGQAGAAHLGYALFFVLPSAWVNVNIHPSKQQVKR